MQKSGLPNQSLAGTRKTNITTTKWQHNKPKEQLMKTICKTKPNRTKAWFRMLLSHPAGKRIEPSYISRHTRHTGINKQTQTAEAVLYILLVSVVTCYPNDLQHTAQRNYYLTGAEPRPTERDPPVRKGKRRTSSRSSMPSCKHVTVAELNYTELYRDAYLRRPFIPLTFKVNRDVEVAKQ